jgi:hypothetical protein
LCLEQPGTPALLVAIAPPVCVSVCPTYGQAAHRRSARNSCSANVSIYKKTLHHQTRQPDKKSKCNPVSKGENNHLVPGIQTPAGSLHSFLLWRFGPQPGLCVKNPAYPFLLTELCLCSAARCCTALCTLLSLTPSILPVSSAARCARLVHSDAATAAP